MIKQLSSIYAGMLYIGYYARHACMHVHFQCALCFIICSLRELSVHKAPHSSGELNANCRAINYILKASAVHAHGYIIHN